MRPLGPLAQSQLHITIYQSVAGSASKSRGFFGDFGAGTRISRIRRIARTQFGGGVLLKSVESLKSVSTSTARAKATVSE
jgi:hypothetical protein